MSSSMQRLIDDFTLAAHEVSAMYTAANSAVVSEQQTQQLVEQLYARNGLYVTPHDMSLETQSEFTARSADTQLKKLQSAQISAATKLQLEEMEAQLIKDFKGKKVTFTALTGQFQPFDALWQNVRTGKPESVTLTAKQITGYIYDISLEQNLVLLTPGFLQRKINPNRKLFMVYVINPGTLQPGVTAR